YGKLAMGLEYYTDVLDVDYLIEAMENDPTIPKRFQKLSASLAELVSDHSLVKFKTLNIQDAKNVASLIRQIDRTNGYLYGSVESEKMVDLVSNSGINNDVYDAEMLYVNKDE